ncbi:hypothetical protein P3T31_001397 [Rhizobium sp. AN70]|nr:hypothetical protein [Rhizobium sp. AN70]
MAARMKIEMTKIVIRFNGLRVVFFMLEQCGTRLLVPYRAADSAFGNL